MQRLAAALALTVAVATLAACGDGDGRDGPASPTPAPTTRPADADAMAGIYDFTADGDFGGGDDLVAAVAADRDRLGFTVAADAAQSISVGGVLEADGSIALTGFLRRFRRGDEALVGRATAGRNEDEHRIVGTLRSANAALAFAMAFVLERPKVVDVRPLAGAYRFTFDPSPSGCDCTTAADLELALLASGYGGADGGDDVDATGTARGRFESGECRVSPSARLFCELAYVRLPAATEPFRHGAFLFGRLPNGTEPGRGRVDAQRQVDDALTLGSWTALRLPPTSP